MRPLLLLVLPLFGCEDSKDPAQSPGGPWIGVGEGLRAATSATAWRIGGNPRTEGNYFDYRESSGPVTIVEAHKKALIQILADPKLIGDGLHPCIPSPGIKVRFDRLGLHPVWVFFCFECHEVFVYEATVQRAHKSFDNGATALARVMKKIFPEDRIIQSLKEE